MQTKDAKQLEFLQKLGEEIISHEIDDYVSGSYLKHIQLYGDVIAPKIENLPNKNKHILNLFFKKSAIVFCWLFSLREFFNRGIFLFFAQK